MALTLEDYKNTDDLDAYICSFIQGRGRKKRGPRDKVWTPEAIILRNMVIHDYIRQGLSKIRIMEQIMDRWKISQVIAYDYINRALEDLAGCNKEEVAEEARVKALERLEFIMSEALDRNNLDAYLKANEQFNKISGLYTEKKEVAVKNEIVFNFGEEEGEKHEDD